MAVEGVTCGLSTGYPPYQYVENGVPHGIDAEIIKLYNLKFDTDIGITQNNWDALVSSFYFRGEPVCLMGMEITEKRDQRFAFSEVLYYRESVLFVLSSSKISSFTDLKDKVISGDKDSRLDNFLKAHEEFDIRLKYFQTKEKAFQNLISGKVSGVIAPLRVGKYLLKNKSSYSIIRAGETMKSPVAVAFKKGDKRIEEMNRNIKTLITDESFKKIINP
ncbi:ABC transporter, substrate-binding protein, family 3 [Bacteriovorax sp. Seq25_V]|nr:ABC transporter, substrate-binding protein, family 3 [Bacteriovorax sp. Seq25_V]